MESTSQIAKLDKLEGKDGRVRPRTVPRQPPPPLHVSIACGNSREGPPDQVNRGDLALARFVEHVVVAGSIRAAILERVK